MPSSKKNARPQQPMPAILLPSLPPLPNMIMSDDESDDNGEDRYSAEYHAKMRAKQRSDDDNKKQPPPPPPRFGGIQIAAQAAANPTRIMMAPPKTRNSSRLALPSSASESTSASTTPKPNRPRAIQHRRFTIDNDDAKKAAGVIKKSASKPPTPSSSDHLLQSPTQLRRMLEVPQATTSRPMFGIAKTTSVASPPTSNACASRAGSEPREPHHSSSGDVNGDDDTDDDDDDFDDGSSLLVPLRNQNVRRTYTAPRKGRPPTKKTTSKLSNLRTAMDKKYRAQQQATKQPPLKAGQPPGLTKNVLAAQHKAYVNNKIAEQIKSAEQIKRAGASSSVPGDKPAVAVVVAAANSEVIKKPDAPTLSTVDTAASTASPSAPVVVVKRSRSRKTVHQPLVDDSDWTICMDVECDVDAASSPKQPRIEANSVPKTDGTVAKKPPTEARPSASEKADAALRASVEIVRSISNPNGDMIKKVAFLRTVINYMLVVLGRPSIELRRGITFEELRQLYGE